MILGHKHSNYSESQVGVAVMRLKQETEGRREAKVTLLFPESGSRSSVDSAPGRDVTESQPVTRGRTTLLLCSGPRHHKIITHHALILSLLCCLFGQTWESAGDQGTPGEPGSKTRHLKRNVPLSKAEDRTEGSSLTPVGQTTSLFLRGCCLTVFILLSGSFSAAHFASVVRDLHHPHCRRP